MKIDKEILNIQSFYYHILFLVLMIEIFIILYSDFSFISIWITSQLLLQLLFLPTQLYWQYTKLLIWTRGNTPSCLYCLSPIHLKRMSVSFLLFLASSLGFLSCTSVYAQLKIKVNESSNNCSIAISRYNLILHVLESTRRQKFWTSTLPPLRYLRQYKKLITFQEHYF